MHTLLQFGLFDAPVSTNRHALQAPCLRPAPEVTSAPSSVTAQEQHQTFQSHTQHPAPHQLADGEHGHDLLPAAAQLSDRLSNSEHKHNTGPCTCSLTGNMALTSSLPLRRKKLSMAATPARRSPYGVAPRDTRSSSELYLSLTSCGLHREGLVGKQGSSKRGEDVVRHAAGFVGKHTQWWNC